MDPRKLQRVIVDALEDVKAQAIEVFNTTEQTGLFDRVILATGTSNRQTRALASHVRDKIKAAGGHVISVEGEETGEWVLVDAGDAVVHIMQPAIRAYYNLEEIWGSKPVRMKRQAGGLRARDGDKMLERGVNDSAPVLHFATGVDDADGDADFDRDARGDGKPGMSTRTPRARASKTRAATEPGAKAPAARKSAAGAKTGTAKAAATRTAAPRTGAVRTGAAKTGAAKTGAARTGSAGTGAARPPAGNSPRSASAAKSAATRTFAKTPVKAARAKAPTKAPVKARRTRAS